MNRLLIDEDRLYVSGYFDKIDGQSRDNLAAFDLASGQLSHWRPMFEGPVRTLAEWNDHLVVTDSNRVNVVSKLSGLIEHKIALNTDETITALSIAGSKAYVGTRENLFSVDLATKETFDFKVQDTVKGNEYYYRSNELLVHGSILFAATHRGVYGFDISTGNFMTSNTEFSELQDGYDLFVHENRLVVGSPKRWSEYSRYPSSGGIEQCDLNTGRILH